jgi:MFS family permease
VLGVLVVVYVLNFLDRQIVSILAESIKHDLNLTDAEIGFLYGTAFAVFYAVFGIPLGRLADVWSRKNLISIGLAFWSLMTAASGLARSFGQLAVARVGVGVGEASASPASFSLLSDWFPPERRGTVLGIYSSGIYLGAGLGLMLGGQVVERWDGAFPEAGPFGLVGWQAAFLIVGLPGLLLSLWVTTLREPRRGQADGVFAKPEPHPWRAFLLELRAVVPPLPLLHLWLAGGPERARRVAANALAGLLIASGSWALVAITGDREQWVTLGIGVYAACSWFQALRLRDPVTASLVFGTPSLRYAAIGLALLAFTGYGIGGWAAPYFLRVLHAPLASMAFYLGSAAALGGWLGVTVGGALGDRLRRTSPTGRLWVALLTAILSVPLGLWVFTTQSLTYAYLLVLPLNAASSMWIGVGAATVQDLVLPRMRATTSAFYILIITFIGFALGPYSLGKLSDAVGDLGLALRLGFAANGLALVFLLLAMRHLARDEASVRERARLAGEADA